MDERYDVIYADPPWWYNSRVFSNKKISGEGSNKTKFGGGAMKHYPLMKDKELVAMKDFIGKIANEESCVLFMWATLPRLDFAIKLIAEWGFEYKTTAFVWLKPKMDLSGWNNGPGYYTASNAEICLLGVKGKSRAPYAKMVDQIIISPVRTHSKKPEEARGRIDLMYPGLNKIELFAREEADGWDVWGNEVESNVES